MKRPSLSARHAAEGADVPRQQETREAWQEGPARQRKLEEGDSEEAADDLEGEATAEMPMVAQAVLLGGNIRVGLEDNLYLEKGVFASNAQLVEKACSIVELMGCSIQMPSEARETLGLKKPS